jgi:hypothetical protein
MRIIYDPAIQEWIDFRCQSMTDALRQMALYAKSLNPEVVIEVNPHGITGGNRAWQAGLDHSRFLKWTEVFWTEEGNPPGYAPDGRLVSKIRATSWPGASTTSCSPTSPTTRCPWPKGSPSIKLSGSRAAIRSEARC